jgi:O-antigen ligase
VAGAIAALPLLQILPLPVSFWQALPGRDVALSSAHLFGFDSEAMPLSLDPGSTLQSFIEALPAFALFAVAHRVSAPGQVRLLLVIVGLALLSFTLGVVQIATGSANFYDTAHEGLPIGLFANRNHQADLLNIGILLSVILGMRPQLFPSLKLFRPVLFAAAAAMAAGVIATGSRSGMVLLVYVTAAAAALSGKTAWSPKRIAVAGIVVVIVPLCLVLAGSQVAEQSLQRFNRQQTDQRFEFWPAAVWTAEHYFPAGSGIGTFDPVFRANEPLSIVGDHYVVHAHNEYIEIPLEDGLPGALLVLCFLIWWIGATIVSAGTDDRNLDGLLGRIGSAIIPIFLLHSALDYPLRMLALMTVFAYACGLLSRTLLLGKLPISALQRRSHRQADPGQRLGGRRYSLGATPSQQRPIGH